MRFLGMSTVAAVFFTLAPNIAALPATTQSEAWEHHNGKAYVLLHHHDVANCEAILNFYSVAIREVTSTTTLLKRGFPNSSKMPALIIDPTTVTLIATIAQFLLAQRRFDEPFEGNHDVSAVTPQQVGIDQLIASAIAAGTNNGDAITDDIYVPGPNLVVRVSLTTTRTRWSQVITRAQGPQNFQQAVNAALQDAMANNLETGSYPISRQVIVTTGGVTQTVVEELANLDIQWVVPSPTQTTIGHDPDGL